MKSVNVSDFARVIGDGIDMKSIKIDCQNLDPTGNYDRILKREGELLKPALQRVGEDYERIVYSEISDKYDTVVMGEAEDTDLDGVDTVGEINARDFITLNSQQEKVGLQVSVSGQIGEFRLTGISDVVVVREDEITVYEIKSSDEVKPEHQVQTTLYAMMIQNIFDLNNDQINTGVIYRGSNSEFNPSMFEYETRKMDVESLLSEGGIFDRSFSLDHSEIPPSSSRYSEHEELYNVLSLNSDGLGYLGFNPNQIQVLKDEGINDIFDLADLVEIEEKRYFESSPEFTDTDLYQRIISKLQDVNLISKAYTAKSIVRMVRDEDYPSFYTPKFGDDNYVEIPSFSEEENVIKVYVDVQYDNALNRISSTSVLIDSPGSTSQLSSIYAPKYGIRGSKNDDSDVVEEMCQNLVEEVDHQISEAESDCYVHLYFYQDSDRRRLCESINSMEDISEQAETVLSLITSKDSVEQPMYTCMKSVIEDSLSLPTTNTGLFSVYDNLPVENPNNLAELRDTYNKRVFDHYLPFRTDNDGIKLESFNRANNFISVTPQHTSNIPEEYFWNATGVSDDIEWEDERRKSIVKFYDNEYEDLKSMIEIIPKMIMRLDEYMSYKSKKPVWNKEKLSDLSKYRLYPSNYAESMISFECIERGSTCDEVEMFETMSDARKMISGKRIVGDVYSDVEGTVNIKPDYDILELDKEQIYERFRLSEGDMVNVSDSSGNKTLGIVSSMSQSFVSVEKMIFPEYQHEDTGTVFSDGYYGSNFNTTDRVSIYKTPDDLTGRRKMKCLENLPRGNPVYNILDLHKKGEDVINEGYLNNRVGAYVSDLESDNVLDYDLNEKQKEFVTSTDSSICTLQGPPGTGKTSAAVANAILSRLYMKNGKSVLVSAPSNTAVDEVMSSVSELIEKISTESESILREIGPLAMYRCGSSGYEGSGASYVPVVRTSNSKDDIEKVLKHANSNDENCIIFSTPSTTAKLIKDHYNNTYDDIFYKPRDIFDLLVVDEASMMNMSDLMLCSSFLKQRGYQVLCVGDHRQMPPIRKFDWEDCQRHIENRYEPYMSVMNTFRQEFENDPEFPIIGLERTYRCHEEVADLLKNNVYSKDGIDYSSQVTDTLNEYNRENSSSSRVLDSSPITIVRHFEENSKMINSLEASIVEKILSDNGDESIGVVTPHNAQKAYIKSISSDHQGVDTVERFQGGERDVIIVSATVSERKYQYKEEDFLLSPQRLNVALSRMKKKAVVIVPNTLLTMIPSDTENYENALFWKRLYRFVKDSNSSSKTVRKIDDEKVEIIST